MITIYIPVYNEERTLERAIRTSCSQKGNCEICVIDDCSTDQSYNIANNLQAEFQNLRVYQNAQKSKDWQEAVSTHFYKFKGDHIVALGADDVLIDGLVESCERHIDAPIIFHNFAVVDDNLNILHINNNGFPHDIGLLPQQVVSRIQSNFWATETGVGSSVRKDCLDWLCALKYWELGAWSDAIGYAAVAIKYGAVYINSVQAGFTKVHTTTGKISYGAARENNPDEIKRIIPIAQDFLLRAGVDRITAECLMIKRGLVHAKNNQ